MQAISALLVGYRDYLTVTRIAGRAAFASESAEKLIVNVVDVNIPALAGSPGLSPSPHHINTRSPAALRPCVFRVEFDRSGFLKSSPPSYFTFLRPLLRSQGFMSFVEDAGVTGELQRLRNCLLSGQSFGPPPTAASDTSGVAKSLFGPASIMSLHTGTYTGGVAGLVSHTSKTPGGSVGNVGSRSSGFGWGGGSGPLNEVTAGLVRDIITGVDTTGKYSSFNIDSSLEADAVYIRLLDWTVMRHLACGAKEETLGSSKGSSSNNSTSSSSVGGIMKKLMGSSDKATTASVTTTKGKMPPLPGLKTDSSGSQGTPTTPEALSSGVVSRTTSYGSSTDVKYQGEGLSQVCRDLVVLLCSETTPVHNDSCVSVLDLAAEVRMAPSGVTSGVDVLSSQLSSHHHVHHSVVQGWHPPSVTSHVVTPGDKPLAFPSLNRAVLESLAIACEDMSAITHHVQLAEDAIVRGSRGSRGSDDIALVSGSPVTLATGTIQASRTTTSESDGIIMLPEEGRTSSFFGGGDSRSGSVEPDAHQHTAAAAAGGGFSRRRRAAGTRMSMIVAGIDSVTGSGIRTPRSMHHHRESSVVQPFTTPVPTATGLQLPPSHLLGHKHLAPTVEEGDDIPARPLSEGGGESEGGGDLNVSGSILDTLPLDDEREWE